MRSWPLHKALVILALLMWPAAVQAAEFTPGSAGYVLEECKTTLAKAGDMRAVHGTYCGAFAEGYFMGVMASSTLKLPDPDPKDPCFEDKAREFKHINNRFCGALPIYDPKEKNAGALLHKVVDTAMLWGMVNEKHLNEPVTTALGSLVQPGRFCDSLPARTSDVEINPALLNLGWSAIFGAKGLVSHQGKFEQCQADIERAEGNSSAFKKTQCGAEVTGFITGLYASSHVHTPKAKAAPRCEKQIERLYSGINPANTMCVKADTDPLFVAKVFVSNYELIRGDPGFMGGVDFFDPGALGAVGYETIYRGFLCRNEAEKRIKTK